MSEFKASKLMQVPAKTEILNELEQLPDSYFNEILAYVKSLSQKDAKRRAKLQAMREAVQDPLYLADLEEVQQDFAAIDHETLWVHFRSGRSG